MRPCARRGKVMLDKLGKRKFVLPIGILLLLGCMFSLMFYPMANMEMKNLPFAIVCLDEGVETPEGDANLGELVADKIVEATNDASSDGSEPPIAWARLSSEEELERTMENNEFYGALVIPRDFSQRQYDTLVDTMQDQIDEMQSTMSDKISLPSGGFSFPAMGGATNSASPALSADAQKMIAAAQAALAGAKNGAQDAATTFQQQQAASANAQKQLGEAQAKQAELQKALDDAKAQLAQLKETPSPSADDQALIDQLTQQVSESEQQLAAASAQVDELTQAAEKAQQSAAAAQDNLAIAQGNAATAAANAMGVEKTATAGSALSARANALISAVSTLKDKIGNLDISDQFSDMGETVAAKALMNVVDTLKEGNTEDEKSDEGSGIVVFLNTAKSPIVANSLQSTMKVMFAEVGFQADIVTIHDGTPEGAALESAERAAADQSGEDTAASSPMSSMMALQILMLPAVMLSLIIGLIITRLVNLRSAASRKERLPLLVRQIVLALVFSGLTALTAFGMYAVVVGGDADFGSMTLFIWAVSFGLMLLIGGLANVALGLGILSALCIIGFGMMTGVLPIQALPVFWQDWVFPWAPQRFVGEGIRAILYMNDGWWNAQTPLFCWFALAGVVLSALALAIPQRKKKATHAKSAG